MNGEPFGVGALVGDTFRVFFGRIWVFVILAFLPSLASNGITYSFLGAAALNQAESPEAAAAMLNMGPAQIFALYVLPIIVYSFTTGLVVMAAYDAKLRRPVRFGVYFGAAVSRPIPILIVTIVVTIAVSVGLVLLIIPGLWVAAVLSSAVTAVVVERIGLGALSRSTELTSGYRWPILGTLVILYICVIILAIVFGLVLVPLLFSFSGITWLILILKSAIDAIVTGFFTVGFVLIYARLREIKEGATVDQIADVFS